MQEKPVKTYASAVSESVPPTPDDSREVTVADYRGYRKLCDIVIETFNSESKHLRHITIGLDMHGTVNVLKFRTPKCLMKWHMPTVQTQIRLLLKEQSDQGLHCLPFH